MKPLVRQSLLAAATVALAAVSTMATGGVAAAADGYQFRVLGERSVSADNITGIDYRAGSDDYVLISDDNARVRTATVALSDSSVGRVHLTGSVTLRQANGSQVRNGGTAVRVDRADGALVWANVADQRRHVPSTTHRAAADGTFVADHPVVPNAATGVREGIEGMTFNTGGSLAVSALGAPLRQDGAEPTRTEGAPVRVSFANRTTGAVLSQLAYELEPAQSRHGSNGLVDILAVDASRYLVMENADLDHGRQSVRVYEASTVGARSVLPFPSLTDAAYTPMTKRLVLDLDDLDVPRLGNVEAMTWGPTLPSGERTLVLVTDNDCGDQTKLVAVAVTLS